MDGIELESPERRQIVKQVAGGHLSLVDDLHGAAGVLALELGGQLLDDYVLCSKAERWVRFDGVANALRTRCVMFSPSMGQPSKRTIANQVFMVKSFYSR